jgi:hypothetical protein
MRDTILKSQCSAVSKHSIVTKHSINFDRTEVVPSIWTCGPRTSGNNNNNNMK